MVLRRGVLCLLFAPLAASRGAAQDRLERELAFARGLAIELGAIGLARDEIGRLQQEYRAAQDQDRIALLAVEVAGHAARAGADRRAQLASFRSAFERGHELCTRAADPDLLLRARTTLAMVAEDYGAWLQHELELARPPDQATLRELRDELARVYALAVEAIDAAVRDLQPRRAHDAVQRQLHDRCWLRQGVLQRELARVDRGDRAWRLLRARTCLADLVLEVGEETALGLRGLCELAQCDELAGDAAAADAGRRAAADRIAAALADARQRRLVLQAPTAALLLGMLQEIAADRARSAIARGDVALARAVLAGLHQQLAAVAEPGADALDLGDPAQGHRALLFESQLLAETGDANDLARAIASARAIAGRHADDHLGLQARVQLRALLAAHPGAATMPLLLELARASLRDQEGERARGDCRSALALPAASSPPAMRLEAFLLFGRAFRLDGRRLEAVLCLQQALDENPSDADGAARTADELEHALAAWPPADRADPALQSVFEAAQKAVLRWSRGGGADKVAWQTGNERLAARDFDAAIAAFAAIPADSPYGERARARTARAQFGAGDLDRARATAASVRDRLAAAAERPPEPARAAARAAAAREADWLLAEIAFVEAYGDDRLGRRKDLARYDAAVAALRAFVGNHGGSDDPALLQAIDALGRLYADRGDLAAADEACAQLQTRDPVRASRLDTVVFAAWLEHAGNLATELAAGTAAERDGRALDRLRSELRKARLRLCSLGADYLRNAPQPQLPLLLHTAEASLLLGDAAQAAEFAARALQLHEGSPTPSWQRLVDERVRPLLGEALLRLGRHQQAYDALLEAERRAPGDFAIVRLLCLCLGGSCTLDANGRCVQDPGLGQPRAAFAKYFGEYRAFALRPEVAPFGLEWYRFHFEAWWFAHQAAAQDSAYARHADALFRTARSVDDFRALKALGDDGVRLFRLFDLAR